VSGAEQWGDLTDDDYGPYEPFAEAELAEARRYSVVVQWSDEDRKWIATVPELPGCRTHGATREEALAMSEDAAAGTIAGLRSAGDPVPPPRLFAPVDAATPA
jgi:predicted RNase H-like HicB family nuclease